MDGAQQGSMLETLKRAATAMTRAGVVYALAGGGAAYARGGAPPSHDVDFVLAESDVPAAEKALAACGMRIIHPPEDWLVKADDGGMPVDLIFRLAGEPVGPAMLSRADELEVEAVVMPVLGATDLVISWLRTLSEHHADFSGTLTSVRPLREQVDWARVRAETGESPFAAAFLMLLEMLHVIGPAESGQREAGTPMAGEETA